MTSVCCLPARWQCVTVSLNAQPQLLLFLWFIFHSAVKKKVFFKFYLTNNVFEKNFKPGLKLGSTENEHIVWTDNDVIHVSVSIAQFAGVSNLYLNTF